MRLDEIGEGLVCLRGDCGSTGCFLALGDKYKWNLQYPFDQIGRVQLKAEQCFIISLIGLQGKCKLPK